MFRLGALFVLLALPCAVASPFECLPEDTEVEMDARLSKDYLGEQEYGLTIQRRVNGEVDFNKNWNDYKTGFGDSRSDYWIGLETMHQWTKSGRFGLLVVLVDWEDNVKYARYDAFKIDSEEDSYKMHLSGFNGTAGDSMVAHNECKFSTKDQDNETDKRNCAETYHGGWWYKACYKANLNGKYRQEENKNNEEGINWQSLKGKKYSYKVSLMMLTGPA